jgi:hypothetical protein
LKSLWYIYIVAHLRRKCKGKNIFPDNRRSPLAFYAFLCYNEKNAVIGGCMDSNNNPNAETVIPVVELNSIFTDKYQNQKHVPFAEEFHALFENPDKKDNINHFLNVIAALFHVMEYARKHFDESFTEERVSDLTAAAFFHDLGKTRQDHRHAVTGALMIENASGADYRNFRYMSIKNYEEKLPLLAAIVEFHDVYGMSSTGEAGIVSIGRAVEKLRAVTHSDAELEEAIMNLWLLSIADILCSRSNKYKLQQWTKTSTGELDDDIDSLLNSFKGRKLRADLVYSKEIAFNRLNPVKASEIQACERIQLLTRESFSNKIFRDGISKETSNTFLELIEAPASLIMIDNALTAVMGQEYPHAFGTMYQFDYALGIFLDIAKYTADIIANENDPERELLKVILREWYAALAEIFAEIYRVKGDLDWNVEFEDIAKSITAADIKSLLGENGLYSMTSTRKSLFRQIFLYK